MNASKFFLHKSARRGVRRRFVDVSSRRLAIEPLEERTLLAFGDLDLTFAREGRQVTDFPGSSKDCIYAVAQQSDGKILAAGTSTNEGVLARFTATGALDPTFGSGGLVHTWLDEAKSVIVQSDGRILVAGSIHSASWDMGVMSYLADGTPDTSFASGGMAILDFGGDDLATGMVLQGDGKIVIAGNKTMSAGSNAVAVARLNAGGSLDSSFGSAGQQTTSVGSSVSVVGVGVDGSGRILVGAGVSISNNWDMGACRYTSSGQLDTSFGSAGVARTGLAAYEYTCATIVQADGRIVVAGQTNSHFALARFTTTGTLDGSFGSAGIATASLSLDSTDLVRAVAVQAGGKLLAAGFVFAADGGIRFGAARFLSSGSVDTSFDGDGVAITQCDEVQCGAYAVCVSPSDGNVILGGVALSRTTDDNFALVRYATNGSLNTSFGGDGKVTVNLGGAGDDTGRAIARQADGKLVVVGSNSQDFGVARYLASGELDTSFGVGGRVSTDFGNRGDTARDVAIQADGKIVVAGHSWSAVTNEDFALARYNADGSLDTTFGTAGKVLLDINSGQVNYLYAMALQADGKIVVGGQTLTKDSTNISIAMARFNANGTLDTTFGSGGIVTENLSTSNEQINDLAIDSAGRIVAGVNAWLQTPYNSLIVLRYLSNGTRDTTFSGDGMAAVAAGAWQGTQALAVQADDKIITAGQSSTGVAVARWDTSGNLDATFGTGGKKTFTAPSNTQTTISGAAVQGDGRILLVGSLTPTGGAGIPDWLLMRCDASGNLDTSVGSQGFATFDFSGGEDRAGGLVVQPDGKVVLAGYASMNATGKDFALVRVSADGSQSATYGTLDPSFDGDGRVTTYVPGCSSLEYGNAVAVQADGKIIAAGRADNDFAIARFLADGRYDTSFGQSGRMITDICGKSTVWEEVKDLAIQSDGKIIAAGVTDSSYMGVVRYLADGRLDTSFGSGGKVKIGFSPSGGLDSSGARGVALQSDGKIVLVGTVTSAGIDFGVARLNADGTLDSSFGTGGLVVTPFPAGYTDRAYDVAIQADGKIVVVGQAGVSSSSYDMAVARYNTDGSLDSSFGNGGRATADLYGQGLPDQANAVAIQPDGKILIGGECSSATGGFVAARFLTNGVLDSSFGSGGTIAWSSVGTTYNAARAMALESDGSILLAGTVNRTDNDYYLMRLRSNGSLAQTQGYTSTLTEYYAGIALQADGKPVLIGTAATTGYTAVDMRVFRLNTDLSTDTTLGGTGYLTVTNFPVLRPGKGQVAVLQPDGKIIVAATAGQSSDEMGTALSLTRLRADGSIDPSFGYDGFVRTNFWYQSGAWSGDEVPLDAALQNDGKVVVVGSTMQSTTDRDFALARYNADGTLDTTFSSDGIRNVGFGGNDEEATALAVQADGKLLVAGTTNTSGTADFALARYNADGSTDTTFSSGCRRYWFGSGWEDRAYDLAVQSDGKIVLVGVTGASNNRDFGILRVGADGVLDSSFSGDGLVTVDLGGTIEAARAVAIQPDGKIVVVGETNKTFGATATDFAVLRLNADGSLDSSFGVGGVLVVDYWYGADGAEDVQVLLNGNILVAGTANGTSFGLACFRPDGSPDTTFSPTGCWTTSVGSNGRATTVLVQSDGKIVAAGQNSDGVAVARFLAPAPPSSLTITSQTIAENQAPGVCVGTFSAADPDPGDTLTYRLASGSGDTDNASFSIVGNELRTAGSFDYEVQNVCTIRVRTTDSWGNWIERSFNISVTNVNEAPTDITLSWSSVPENSPTATVVGNLGSLDPDAGDVFTYSLADSAGGRFKVVGNQLQVDNGALLDYEAATSHNITVRTTDACGLSYDKSFTISVTDQAELFAVAAADWTDLGLTLTLGSDGKLHFYRTSTTTDAVPACDPTKVTGLSIVGRGLSDTLTDIYAGQVATLYMSQATLKINQDNTISDSAVVAIDGGCLDLGGKTDTVGSLTLLAGSVVNGTLNAASYTIQGGAVSATLGPGAIIKQTGSAATVTTPINATTVDVQAGQLTATSIVSNTLTIGAGCVVTIAETVQSNDAAVLATTTSTTTQTPVDPTPTVEPAMPVAPVTIVLPEAPVSPPEPSVALSTTSTTTFAELLPTITPTPAATDVVLALVAPAIPATAPVPSSIISMARKAASKAAITTAAATRVLDTSTLDSLALMLAMERAETELSAQRHLRALDAVLAEGAASFLDLADVFASTRPARRRMDVRSVSV